jgi:farnesyl diphosphate synthase
MDNDDTRRGKPSCHKQFDEAQAILAGDALQALAFEILAQNESYEQIIVLAKAAGREGMALGQSLDIQHKGKKISKETLHTLHQLKTGKLITVSLMLGMMCGEVTAEMEEVLAAYAENFGLAFQLRDDLLDKEHQGNAQEMKSLFKKAQALLKKLPGKNAQLLLHVGEMLYDNH